MSGFEVLLRLALGEQVTQTEALAVLYRDACSRDGVARMERVARIKARDNALCDAAAVLGVDSPCAWVLAARLEAAVARFDVRIWPRLCAGMECDLTPSEAALYRAFLTGEKVPRTQRRLYDLLLTR